MDLGELVNSPGTAMEWHKSVSLTHPVVSCAAALVNPNPLLLQLSTPVLTEWRRR